MTQSQQIRDLLRDAMGKQAFETLTPEERKRITGVMKELVAQSGMEGVKSAIQANKGKINNTLVGPASSKDGGFGLSGPTAILLPLISAIKSVDQGKEKEGFVTREPNHPEPNFSDNARLSTPFPDPMAPPAPPRPR